MTSHSDIEAELNVKAKWDTLFEFFRLNGFVVVFFKRGNDFEKIKLTMDDPWEPDRIKKGCEAGTFLIRRNKPYEGFEVIDQVHHTATFKMT